MELSQLEEDSGKTDESPRLVRLVHGLKLDVLYYDDMAKHARHHASIVHHVS